MIEPLEGPGDLAKVLKGKTVILGVGNRLRSDDGIGPELVDRLEGRVGAVCINGENAPERYVGKIARENPDTLVVVDAVHLDLGAGSFRIMSPEDFSTPFFTTHDIPLGTLIGYLKTRIECDVFVVGVQPTGIGLGTELSIEARGAVAALEALFLAALPAHEPRTPRRVDITPPIADNME